MIKSFFRRTCSLYEIYPQSEIPRLTRIAHLDFDHTIKAYLLPGIVIWRDCVFGRSIFRVWDYRLDHSTSFSVVNCLYYEPEVYFLLSKVL